MAPLVRLSWTGVRNGTSPCRTRRQLLSSLDLPALGSDSEPVKSPGAQETRQAEEHMHRLELRLGVLSGSNVKKTLNSSASSLVILGRFPDAHCEGVLHNG